jgi:hypothetical protein
MPLVIRHRDMTIRWISESVCQDQGEQASLLFGRGGQFWHDWQSYVVLVPR